jgi:hypothetical protein
VFNTNALSGQLSSTLGLLRKVQQLALYENRLTGVIPNQLARCTDMASLFLYSNALTGQIPPALGLLAKLSLLNLHSNQLNGTTPSEPSACTDIT